MNEIDPLSGQSVVCSPGEQLCEQEIAEAFIQREGESGCVRPSKMRAIIQSIHSQIPGTIANLGRRFDMIISMDSHLDVSLGGDGELYPMELRAIAARTGAHAAIRNMTGGLASLKERKPDGHIQPRFIVAIPHLMLAKHAADIESKLPASLRLHDQGKSIASVVGFLAGTMGIEIYESPPKPLSNLARLARRSRSWILDVDVDYMYDMQKECYTQIRGTEPGVLQSMLNVVQFIQESRPETIILSEVRVSAIRDKESNFSRLVARLSTMGYEIEENGVFESDAKAIKGMRVCKEFYRTISRKLMSQHLRAAMRGDLKAFKEEEEVAAREFFRDKGYSV